MNRSFILPKVPVFSVKSRHRYSIWAESIKNCATASFAVFALLLLVAPASLQSTAKKTSVLVSNSDTVSASGLEESDGLNWLATDRRMAAFWEGKRALSNYLYSPNRSDTFGPSSARDIRFDCNGRIWIGTVERSA